MKFFTSQLAFFLKTATTRRNIRLLLRFLLVLVGLATLYSVLFHVLMLYEGQRHSWITGFYWTLTVMSTLGFGDITFKSDIGRVFSIVVLLSGMVSLLMLLPFTFIEFFYAPLDAGPVGGPGAAPFAHIHGRPRYPDQLRPGLDRPHPKAQALRLFLCAPGR